MQFIDAHHKPELLAPAGTMDALLAALGAGANAVYLGLDKLNARSNAGNFTLETLAKAVAVAHAHNARVYVTVNVVILPHEMAEALALIEDAWALGVDAFIIQDLGLIRVLHDTHPEVRIHASTQMNVHSSESIRALHDLGVKRVTLARETSLREIETLAAVARELDMEVESFVHGAICICYSGQCFLSSLIGRRSANRGQCAQPCRLTYELVNKDDEQQAVVGQHLLSPKDLAGIEHIGDFINAGVASLKIEGRMKSPSYVSAVVSVYREALDSNGELEDIEATYNRLAEAFSRGFTPAYLESKRDNDIMSYTRPNNRGMLIGRIVGFEGSEAIIACDKALHRGDVIEVWTGKGNFTQTLDEEPTRLDAGNGSQKERIALALKSFAKVGDRVFRVRNADINASAQEAIDRALDKRITLDFAVEVVEGKPLAITVTDGSGGAGSAQGPVVEHARTKAISADEVREHVDRLGGTLYEVGTFQLNLDEGVGLSFSALHKTRSAALAAYENQVHPSGHARELQRAELPPLAKKSAKKKAAPLQLDLVATVQTAGGARSALNAGAAYAFVSAYDLEGEEPNANIWPVLPRVSHDNEVDTYLGIAERFGHAVCSTLGQLRACAYRGIPAQAHWSLNATNAYTVNELARMGAQFVWLSPELSGKQIASIARRSDVPVGIALGGLTEVMVTEHCVLMSMGPCNQNCRACARRQEVMALKDRMGYHFRVMTDVTGRTHVYNSVPLDLSDALPEILDAGVSAVRLDLETALTSSVSREVAQKRQLIVDALAGRPIPRADEHFTRGHFYRGVV